MGSEFDPTDSNAAMDAYERMTKAEALLAAQAQEIKSLKAERDEVCASMEKIVAVRIASSGMRKDRDEWRECANHLADINRLLSAPRKLQ